MNGNTSSQSFLNTLTLWLQKLFDARQAREAGVKPVEIPVRLAVPGRPMREVTRTRIRTEGVEASNLEALNEMLGADISPDPGMDLTGHTAEVAVAMSQLDALPKHSREETEEQIAELGQIPSLASIVQHLKEAGTGDSLDVSVMVETLSRDPGLTVKILRMTNSPFYAPSYKVDDLGEAVQILGSRKVSYLVDSARTLSDFDQIGTSINWRFLWMHSFACGLLCSEIARIFKIEAPSKITLSGMLHDLGKVLLALCYPDHYGKVLSACYHQGLRLEDAESLLFGMNHLEAGFLFSALNGLSDEVGASMRWHDQPTEAGEHETAVALVNVSNALCKLYGLGFSGNSLSYVPDALEDLPGWSILQARSPNPPDGDQFRTEFEALLRSLKTEVFSIISQLSRSVFD